jgi:hypothetical protein
MGLYDTVPKFIMGKLFVCGGAALDVNADKQFFNKQEQML